MLPIYHPHANERLQQQARSPVPPYPLPCPLPCPLHPTHYATHDPTHYTLPTTLPTITYLTNPCLQFNWDIFKSEQIEYEREGIEWKNIEFVDNQVSYPQPQPQP